MLDIFKLKENRFTAFMTLHSERKTMQSEPTVVLLRELNDMKVRYPEVRDITSGIISQIINDSNDVERVITVIDSEDFESLMGFIEDRTAFDTHIINNNITLLKKMHYNKNKEC